MYQQPEEQLQSGVLYVVATPIGNLGDASDRMRHILASVDAIAAEDTRRTRQLLSHFGIETPCFSVHEHNERQRIDKIQKSLNDGQSIALVSDAGTPLISDPGYPLVAALRDAGIKVVPVPGPSALITALSAAGLPSDRFWFEGFLPAKSGTRLNRLTRLATLEATVICYESSHRILDSLKDIQQIFGSERQIVIARELTKTFETFLQGTLTEVIETVESDVNQQKGEFVVMLQGYQPPSGELGEDVTRLADLLQPQLAAKQVSRICADYFGVKKNLVYQYLLDNSDKG